MAATITWSVDSHRHETAGKQCILSVAYRVTGVDGDFTDSLFNDLVLDRPSDSDMKEKATFLGSGNTAIVAAVKAKLGDTKVSEIEEAVKAAIENLKAPTETWTSGPTAS